MPCYSRLMCIILSWTEVSQYNFQLEYVHVHRLLLTVRICGCGSGESGCSACGCCKACARELDGQEARQRGIFDAVKEMIPLDLLLGLLPCLTSLPFPDICVSLGDIKPSRVQMSCSGCDVNVYSVLNPP